MSKIIGYKNLTSWDFEHLERDVIYKIKEGWQPIGGIVYLSNSDWFAQTMVKYEEKS